MEHPIHILISPTQTFEYCSARTVSIHGM